MEAGNSIAESDRKKKISNYIGKYILMSESMVYR
jgi:hypothetical protein